MRGAELRPIGWLPTFGFFFFVAIELWMFAGVDRLFEDPGVGRHLRTAEFILETGTVPRTDPLSFTAAGRPWVDFEWGFETTLGELYRAGGLGLIAAFIYALFGATLLGIYRTLLQSGFSLSVVVIYTGLAFLTLHLHFSARPVLFTYLFLALVVEVWFRNAQPRLRDWILLPLVFVAWANLHAGWFAALVFLGLALSGRLIDRVVGRVSGEDAPLVPWLGLTLLCACAASINPWGWSLYGHIFELATRYQSFALWDEYLPPDFRQPSMSAITVMAIVGIVMATRLRRLLFRAQTRRRMMGPSAVAEPLWPTEALFPVLFFLYEGMKAQRHVILLMEVAAVPVARDLEVLLHGKWWPNLRWHLGEFQARQRSAGGDAWLCLVAAVIFTILFLRAPISQAVQVAPNVTPQLVDFIRAHPDRFQRPMTTTWNAGPLLWKARPDFRVSIDDRGDFYGDAAVFNFVNTTNGSAGWQDRLSAGNFDALILEPYLAINKLLPALPNWKQVYRDEHAVVYWRD